MIAINGRTIPCVDPERGWWSPANQCYYRLMSPQPSPEDYGLEPGPDADTRQAYEGACANPGSPIEWDYAIVWLNEPPDGYPITPEQLAMRAIDSMTLLGPDIRTSVGSGGHALVGVPVWFWTPVTATRWGPNSATASVPGLSVTAVARARHVVWQFGDGTSLTCGGPGTPFDPARGRVESPDCGHVYEHSSARAAGATYPITATTTWDVTWSGGGDSGSLVLTRVGTSALSVAELEVLIR